MGEVIPFPIKSPRATPDVQKPVPASGVDLDRLAQIASYSVLIKAWSRIGAGLPAGGEAEVVFQGERWQVTREEAFECAYALIDARDVLLTSLGAGGDRRVMRECEAAFRLMSGRGFQRACAGVGQRA